MSPLLVFCLRRVCLTKRLKKCLLLGAILLTAVLLAVVLTITLRLNEDTAPNTIVQQHLKQRKASLSVSKATVKDHSSDRVVITTDFHLGHSLDNVSRVNDSTGSIACQEWVSRAPKPPYFLTAVLLVRIYVADKAKLTTKELKMWLQYLRYAGIEHIYVYDAWVKKSESQLSKLKAFISDGYVTYIDWHIHNPYTISGTQVAAYQHCIDHYSQESQWQAAIDIDEYPFSPKDTSPGFLYRYMKDYSIFHHDISEVTMQNYLFLGKPLDKELLIERLFRRTPKPANPLVKPIYELKHVRAGVHHNTLKKGMTRNAPAEELRLNHYWGARLQNWGNDTEEVLGMTIPDDSMRPVIDAFKHCEAQVRQYLE